MGGVSTKAIASSITDQAVSDISKNLTTCEGTIDDVISVDVKNIKGDVIFDNLTLNQESNITDKCVIGSTNAAKIAQGVINSIKQTADSSSQAVLSSISSESTATITDIENKMKQNIENINITKMKTSIQNKIKINISNVIGAVSLKNISASQSNSIMINSAIESSNTADIIQSASQSIAQSVTSKQSTLIDSLANLLSSAFLIPIAFFGGIILILLTFGGKIFGALGGIVETPFDALSHAGSTPNSVPGQDGLSGLKGLKDIASKIK